MIDFTNCPKDKVWLLFDSEGNSKRITTDTELHYARLEIATKKLEGYYLVREDDMSEKYEIDKYGHIEDYPLDLFCNVTSLLANVLRVGFENYEKDKKESRT
jgi:hypothetical protein